ncbi:MAG TPA: hypothetical protein VLI04_01305, partial [Nocardioidaceae bacterium]|nr:hypothetical protein [Nocardioidaceae bacterium]
AYGGSGNDNLLVYGGSGYGGPGDDELWYQTKDAVLLDGGEGWDLATWLDAPARLVLDLVTGKALVGKSAVSVGGLEDVVGTRFDDVLRGDDNANKLSGVLGNDKLFGRGGDDQIWGGSEYEEATSGDLADGGEGTDQCDAPTTVACE